MLTRFTTLLSLLLFFTTLNGQSSLNALYSQAKYDECLTESRQQLNSNPADSTALFFQGLCLIKAEDYKTAYSSLKAAEMANFQALAACQAQQALCLTQMEKPEEALAILEKLNEGGFSNYTLITQAEFEPLTDHARYQVVRDSVHRRSFPCHYDPNYTHFDFWVGEWEVYVGENKVGENTISKQKGGCALLEQYTTARDYVGQSHNYYDPADGLWKQTWIDNSSGIMKYVESERKEDYLQFISTSESRPASYVNLRMTFSKNADGSVRQHIEQQDQEGSWQTAFDGKYVRKK